MQADPALGQPEGSAAGRLPRWGEFVQIGIRLAVRVDVVGVEVGPSLVGEHAFGVRNGRNRGGGIPTHQDIRIP